MPTISLDQLDNIRIATPCSMSWDDMEGDGAVRHCSECKLNVHNLSEMTRDEKRLFVDVYDRFGIPIDWNPGDVAIVCNYRFAHGRPGIHLEEGEERELGVLLGDTFERIGDLDGKW